MLLLHTVLLGAIIRTVKIWYYCELYIETPCSWKDSKTLHLLFSWLFEWLLYGSSTAHVHLAYIKICICAFVLQPLKGGLLLQYCENLSAWWQQKYSAKLGILMLTWYNMLLFNEWIEFIVMWYKYRYTSTQQDLEFEFVLLGACKSPQKWGLWGWKG